MRLLQLLIGLVIFVTAPWLCGLAAIEAWYMLKGDQKPPLEFSIGTITITGWPYVGAFAAAGIFLAVGGYYVLFPQEERRHWR